MNLLSEHFDRVRQAKAEGKNILSGIFFDVGGTLFKFNEPRPEVIDFAKWNHQKRLFPNQTIFTGDLRDAASDFEKFKQNPQELGLQDLRAIKPKQRLYREAEMGRFETDEKDKLVQVTKPAIFELVVDDNPYMPDMHLTHWDPYDPKVIEFLKSRAYEDFTP